jgi:hypothetical protein
MGFTTPGRHQVSIEKDGFLGVVVADTNERTMRQDLEVCLLVDLAPERLIDAFTGLDLAARKLPETREVRALAPPGQQEPAPGVTDDSDGDVQHKNTRAPSKIRIFL